MEKSDIIQLAPIDQIHCREGEIPTVEEALANCLRHKQLLGFLVAHDTKVRGISIPTLWEKLITTCLNPSVDEELLLECMRQRLKLMEKFQRQQATSQTR